MPHAVSAGAAPDADGYSGSWSVTVPFGSEPRLEKDSSTSTGITRPPTFCIAAAQPIPVARLAVARPEIVHVALGGLAPGAAVKLNVPDPVV